MSRKELHRPGLLKASVAGRITNRQVAEALRISVRHAARLKARFKIGGAAALCHRSRGQPSPRRLTSAVRDEVMRLMRSVYVGFNDVHLTEKLREIHGLHVCRESVRRIRRRDREGRFAGVRFNVEDIPRLPTFPARWVLDDPRRRPYLVFWTYGDGAYALKMMPNDDGTAVLVTLDNGETNQIDVVHRPLFRGSGIDLFYVCPWCRKPRRHLYLLSVVETELVDYQGLRCQRCAGLRYRIQGYYRSAFSRRLFRQPDGRTTIPLPREPWDPRAVSDPRLIADEFRGEAEDPPPPPGAGADDVRPVGGAAGGAKR